MDSDPGVLEDVHKGKRHKQKISIFEKLRPAEVCRIDPPTEKFSDILEQTEQNEGEPYEQQQTGSGVTPRA